MSSVNADAGKVWPSVGMKCVCIDPVDELVRGRVYTVTRVGDIEPDMIALSGLHPDRAWYVERFRPVQSTAKTEQEDVQLFEALVNDVSLSDRVDFAAELLNG